MHFLERPNRLEVVVFLVSLGILSKRRKQIFDPNENVVNQSFNLHASHETRTTETADESFCPLTRTRVRGIFHAKGMKPGKHPPAMRFFSATSSLVLQRQSPTVGKCASCSSATGIPITRTIP